MNTGFSIFNGSKFYRYVRAANRKEALRLADRLFGEWGDAEEVNRFGTRDVGRQDRFGYEYTNAPSVQEIELMLSR